MRSSFTPPSAGPFDMAVSTLDEALRAWNKGASPGLLSRAAVSFDQAAKQGNLRGAIGAAVARALAGDLDSARRRLMELLDQHPNTPEAYFALGVLLLRDPDPLAHAQEAAFALIAARDLAPGVPCIERTLAVALCAGGHFMLALQAARSAISQSPDDLDAKLWSALLRLYYGGDITAANVLVELPDEAQLQLRAPSFWLGAAAGHYARAEFPEARQALRRAIAPLRVGNPVEIPLADVARRWFREVRGAGAGVPMSGERWLRDVGGVQSDYVRTRNALSTLREACLRDAERAREDGVDPVELDSIASELEARTRRGMLEWSARLVVRGFAEAFLPLAAYLEAPPMEVLAAMGLVILDG